MKAILVMDINDEELIGKMGNSIHIFNDKYKCNWKLKPMPKKKDINYAEKTSDGYYTLFSKRYVNGFNACIDEILGETYDE